MMIEPTASKAGSPVIEASEMPAAATTRPLIAAVSSARTVSTSGSLEFRSAAHTPRPRRVASSCCHAVRQA